ncbi:OsmC domain/YcaO domain-containing protein [Kushneria aurantia]|uniref:OsmC domain/YcaO domain-containing protein n=1 Tax=Kushneria aurantia TaxID=504092 RepID=A0ABV6G7L4_9GAMM|nr:OsmC domain/YcaO domain-containing protein [Kushneria aurantia]
MEIKVNFLENQRLEAKFDDFSVITDQPIRYKGDGSAPGPFDYFLASSVLCAAHFIRVYCSARDIPTDNIRLSQNNIVDPENRYNQVFKIQVELPEGLSDRDRTGILRSAERCTVKRVVQNDPAFQIEAVDHIDEDAGALLMSSTVADATTWIEGKDLPLEQTVANMTAILERLGMKIEVTSWRNIVPNVWSLNIRDAASPMCFTNGKGASREAALCSALGEFIERLSCNFFYNDQFFGREIANSDFVHYPDERWFKPGADDAVPEGLLDDHCRAIFDPDGELRGSHLIDTNSGRRDRGIVALPFVRHSDGETVWFPSNLIENLYLSNGMSAGNSVAEAQVQCLSEIFERAVKKQIIEQELALPEVPAAVLDRYPALVEGIKALEAQGYPLLVRDASLGGRFPVACITLMNPRTGGVFASFGAHPNMGVALERSLTELLQGRSFEGLNDLPQPTFSSEAVTEPNNFVEHFIDSSGLVSWRFFSDRADVEFYDWDFSATTEEEQQRLFAILQAMNLEAYVAVHEELGAPACRILVPGYSEVYPIEDLVWDNTNMALDFRADILDLHRLDDAQLSALLERLEESELDEQMKVLNLIGIEFDDNSVWAELTLLELKLLIQLALGQLEDALDRVEMFLQFHDNSVARELFYRAVHALLEIELDNSLVRDDFLRNLRRMYGEEMTAAAVGSVDGNVRFHGLTPTSMALEGIERHQRLIESYQKLHQWRARHAKRQSR